MITAETSGSLGRPSGLPDYLTTYSWQAVSYERERQPDLDHLIAVWNTANAAAELLGVTDPAITEAALRSVFDQTAAGHPNRPLTPGQLANAVDRYTFTKITEQYSIDPPAEGGLSPFDTFVTAHGARFSTLLTTDTSLPQSAMTKSRPSLRHWLPWMQLIRIRRANPLQLLLRMVQITSS